MSTPSRFSIRRIAEKRYIIGARIEARKIATTKPFTIISDDCWGGQIYRFGGLPYLTPTVGLQVWHPDYLSFIGNLGKPDFLDFEEVDSHGRYPKIRNPYALLLCIHYETAREAIQAFRRRYQRIVWDNILYKIDFGKPWYRLADVNLWNRMALRKSVALIYPGVAKDGVDCVDIHNQLSVPCWRRDGAKMYFSSRRNFNIYDWLHTGEVRQPGIMDNALFKFFHDRHWIADVKGFSGVDLDFAKTTEQHLVSSPTTAPRPCDVAAE